MDKQGRLTAVDTERIDSLTSDERWTLLCQIADAPDDEADLELFVKLLGFTEGLLD